MHNADLSYLSIAVVLVSERLGYFGCVLEYANTPSGIPNEILLSQINV